MLLYKESQKTKQEVNDRDSKGFMSISCSYSMIGLESIIRDMAEKRFILFY